MEKGNSVSDPQEEVRKLQEKVRELELQLSQKGSAAPKNGISSTSSSPNGSGREEDEGLVPVYDVDVSPNTWLVSSGVDGVDPRAPRELFSALLLDASLQERALLYAALCNAEQDRRKNIDSRTFTRPKKRMGRPSLELLESLAFSSKPADSTFSWATEANDADLDNMTCSLLESSLINSVYNADASTISDISSQFSVVNKKQKVAHQQERRRGSLVISENNDDADAEDLVPHFKLDNGNSVTYHNENKNFSNFEVLTMKTDMKEEINSTLLESSDFTTSLIDSALMDANLMDTVILSSKPKLNSTIHQLNRTFTPSPPAVMPSSRKASHEILEINESLNNTFNQTFVKEDEESPMNSQGSQVLGSTFSVEANGHDSGQKAVLPLARPGSTNSGADDDQLSSTSESSHTSVNRLMSMGDVQQIARLQEQSLVVSTPSHRHIPKLSEYAEEELSPIVRASVPDCSRSSGSSEIQTGGYGSDHSSRSPMSSLHSSPAGSPFGSSTVLPGSTHTQDIRLGYRPNGVLQRKNTYGLIPPRKMKEGSLRPPAPVAAPSNLSRPTARSGLRPPMIRTGVSSSSALPRPSGTGIPRPPSASRIPPPKVRPSISNAPRKEWTDECF